MHNHLISPQEIRKWAHEIAYQLDQPGVLVLDEITSTVRNWEEEPYKSDLKFCLASPVTYESVVSNLGMAILYNEINDNGVHPSTTGVLCERCYFPEKKLLSRLEKKGYPLFSKENFVPIKNFDVFGISSYYPLQFLNFPRMFEMSDIPVWSKDRKSDNSPIILGGGISFYNPEPVSDFFDCFFIGEGEKKLLHVLNIAKECKDENGDVDREKFLYRIAKETDYMYVPEFYDVKYFSGFGVKERTSKIPEAKPVISRALANIYDIPPLTKTFVPVVDSADMSIGSCEISRGKCALDNSVVYSSDKRVKGEDILSLDSINALKGGTFRPISILDKVTYEPNDKEKLLRIRTSKGNELICSEDHPIFLQGKYQPAVLATKGDLVGLVSKTQSVEKDYAIEDEEISLMAALIADGTLATSKNRVSISKKRSDAIASVATCMYKLGILHFSVVDGDRITITTKTFNTPEEALSLSPQERHQAWLDSKMYKLLEKWHLTGHYSETKVFPDFVFEFSDRQVKLLLTTLFAFDGSVCLVGGSRAINLGSKSREQAMIIKELLLRFGIIAKVPFKMNGGAYQVQIRNFTESNLKNASNLFKGHSFDQEDKLEQLQVINEAKDSSLLSVDCVPYEAWKVFEDLKQKLNLTWSEINEELISYPSTNNIPYKKSRTKKRVSRTFISKAVNSPIFNRFVHSDDTLIKILSKDVYWDSIISIERVESEKCFDLTTECPVHSYNINGFYVHNCSASCSFCEGSARTMPLRERPTDVAIKAFDEIKRETGCLDITPYGFNLSDHSNIRTLIKHLAKDQDVKIQMSSQRIDMFTRDFASVAYMSGNRSVTLAVEGGSQRLRDIVNKNLSTQQIMEAFEIAMAEKFNKVKIYMIANLPFERCTDIDGTPSQLTADPANGPAEYYEEDAVNVVYEDGTSVTVSKNFFFQKRVGEVSADMLKVGEEVYVDYPLSKTKKTVKETSRVASKLYGPEKDVSKSLVGLMQQLADRRDYWARKNGKEMVLNWSFTPFTSKNFTPFQYASCMGGLTNKKTLTPAVEKARELGMKFRVGTSSDTSTIAQVLTLGDRRLNKVIYRAYKEGITQYFGGMSCGADPLGPFENLLKEEVGHTYETYGSEKELFQAFPWSFLDVGMTEEHMRERYLTSKEEMNSAFGCFNKCVSCGACMTSQKDLPSEAYIDISEIVEEV